MSRVCEREREREKETDADAPGRFRACFYSAEGGVHVDDGGRMRGLYM